MFSPPPPPPFLMLSQVSSLWFFTKILASRCSSLAVACFQIKQSVQDRRTHEYNTEINTETKYWFSFWMMKEKKQLSSAFDLPRVLKQRLGLMGRGGQKLDKEELLFYLVKGETKPLNALVPKLLISFYPWELSNWIVRIHQMYPASLFLSVSSWKVVLSSDFKGFDAVYCDVFLIKTADFVSALYFQVLLLHFVS